MSYAKSEISLLIPTMNRPGNIDKLLGSLYDHGYLRRANLKPVIVDSSLDTQTKNVAISYGASYLDAPGMGKSTAMNVALDQLKTEFVGFLDDDIVIINDTWLDNLVRNFTKPEIGYVSGRVIAHDPQTDAQKNWERKGALNKGPKRIQADQDFFKKRRLYGVPVQLFTMGANHIMRKIVLDEIGGHDERFGPGQVLPGAGADLDLSYNVLRLGYTAIYDPEAVVGHNHPDNYDELKSKMFQYGISDTAIHTKFFAEYGDIRSLFQVFFRTGQNLNRMRKGAQGKYPLPPEILWESVKGNLVGPFKYIRHRHTTKRTRS